QRKFLSFAPAAYRNLTRPKNAGHAHSQCECQFHRLLPSQITTDKSVQTLDDLVDNKVIQLLPIDRNDRLLVESGDTRVMTTLAVPALIQIENVFVHRTFLI